MKKSKNVKIIAILLCAAMIAATALFSACSSGKTVGTGKTSFKLEITKADGTKTTYTVKTDDLTVGDALVSANLTPADSKTSGMITTLDNTTLDYNVDQSYWGFYIDGTMATAGAFDTNIATSSTYAFKAETVPQDSGAASDASGVTSAS
ncbi:MAG: hypothetical protein FWD71_05130 [Oscillospiraceae bacterium]|nr:hypothetical protein [Oscillospiraceae bacterium]